MPRVFFTRSPLSKLSTKASFRIINSFLRSFLKGDIPNQCISLIIVKFNKDSFMKMRKPLSVLLAAAIIISPVASAQSQGNVGNGNNGNGVGNTGPGNQGNSKPTGNAG